MAQCGFISLCLGFWITAIIISININVSNGDQALDCCLKVSNHPIPKRIVICYHEQRKGEGCPIDAVVFRTRKGRYLCTPPDEDWVKDLKLALDNKTLKKNLLHYCRGMTFKRPGQTHSHVV